LQPVLKLFTAAEETEELMTQFFISAGEAQQMLSELYFLPGKFIS
jgi:hypothetical protein